MQSLLEWLPYLALVATVGCGVMAGLLFAFSNVVMRALAQLPPAAGLEAMQRINVAIVNPVFLTCFVGTTLVSAIIAAITAVVPDQGWLFGASLAYLVGVFGVTVARNVPLNNTLAAAPVADAATHWPAYVESWGRWNHVRTVAAVAATAAFAIGLFDWGARFG
jgi:uncharacterized membrane protein